MLMKMIKGDATKMTMTIGEPVDLDGTTKRRRGRTSGVNVIKLFSSLKLRKVSTKQRLRWTNT
jgi:hypothetical protein